MYSITDSIANNCQNSIAVSKSSAMATTPKSRGEKNRGEEEIWQGREHGRGCMARVVWQQRLQRREKIAVSQERRGHGRGEGKGCEVKNPKHFKRTKRRGHLCLFEIKSKGLFVFSSHLLCGFSITRSATASTENRSTIVFSSRQQRQLRNIGIEQELWKTINIQPLESLKGQLSPHGQKGVTTF